MDVPARDRTRVTELWAALQWIPDGPENRTFVPQGALVLWRNRNGGEERFRAVLLGIYDDVRWNRKLSGRLESVLTFENTTLPWARSEYAEGRRIASEELEWSFVRAGVGLGTRFTIAPSLQENAVEAALTYEPGVLFFRRGSDTSEFFHPPSDALHKLEAMSKDRFVSALAFGLVEVGLGHKEKALDWLEKAADDREGRLVFLRVFSPWDPLRAEPRFQALVRRLKIPPA